MRYSFTSDEQTPEEVGASEVDKSLEEEDEREAITGKIPIEKFCKIHNTSLIYDDPIAIIRVVLLKAKIEYTQCYTEQVYAVYVRTENEESWFGPPAKNLSVGVMTWDKKIWDKIYGFTLSLNTQEDF